MIFKTGDRVSIHPSESAEEIEDQTGHPGVVAGLKGTVIMSNITNVWDEVAHEVKLDYHESNHPHHDIVLCFPGSELHLLEEE